MDSNFTTDHSVRVSKGDTFPVPILTMISGVRMQRNSSKPFSDRDLLVTVTDSPDWWLDQGPPGASQSIPSVWGNQLTFLAGPRACIGFKFSLIEMKALLFTLIRSFEFELAVPSEQITRKTAIVTQPEVKSEPTKGGQLPMIIRPVTHAT